MRKEIKKDERWISQRWQIHQERSHSRFVCETSEILSLYHNLPKLFFNETKKNPLENPKYDKYFSQIFVFTTP